MQIPIPPAPLTIWRSLDHTRNPLTFSKPPSFLEPRRNAFRSFRISRYPIDLAITAVKTTHRNHLLLRLQDHHLLTCIVQPQSASPLYLFSIDLYIAAKVPRNPLEERQEVPSPNLENGAIRPLREDMRLDISQPRRENSANNGSIDREQGERRSKRSKPPATQQKCRIWGSAWSIQRPNCDNRQRILLEEPRLSSRRSTIDRVV